MDVPCEEVSWRGGGKWARSGLRVGLGVVLGSASALCVMDPSRGSGCLRLDCFGCSSSKPQGAG